MIFELDTSKEQEKLTDHDGAVRFLKSQRSKSYIYIMVKMVAPKWGQIDPPL